jgi:hypothetical protein
VPSSRREIRLCSDSPATAQTADTLPFRSSPTPKHCSFHWGGVATACSHRAWCAGSGGDYAAGLFTEFGAQWLLTSNLGFGAAWTATLQGGRSEVERLTIPASGQIMRTTTGVNTISGSLGALAVRGTVYL